MESMKVRLGCDGIAGSDGHLTSLSDHSRGPAVNRQYWTECRWKLKKGELTFLITHLHLIMSSGALRASFNFQRNGHGVIMVSQI